ncbi:hypothetical protein MANES_01G169000v8 [Manihot esculenta]|uniref:Uncharacterized protein n=1 Tax=Manihot esculenta TaxID=3983 RepID=A0ACB7IGK6_MANES|nr:hypothetical protein MANES_01G169000v8 [Manihot esculenta]
MEMEAAKYWEEEASVWPPRFYFCNFCGREFRSAQALGGHMNVHRRDRASLKQSPSAGVSTPMTMAIGDTSVIPGGKKKENVSRKRQRSDEAFINESSSMKKDNLQADVNKRVCQDATQDLDLELRLGFSHV